MWRIAPIATQQAARSQVGRSPLRHALDVAALERRKFSGRLIAGGLVDRAEADHVAGMAGADRVGGRGDGGELGRDRLAATECQRALIPNCSITSIDADR